MEPCFSNYCYCSYYFIGQSPSEANSRSADQEITHLLWNPIVPYRGHTRQLLGPILGIIIIIIIIIKCTGKR